MLILTLLSLLLLLTPVLSSPTVYVQPRQSTTNDFGLRVWKAHPRDPNPIDGPVEIEPNGDAIFNATLSPKVYRYAFSNGSPGPSPIYQRGTGKLAYLQASETPGLYQLKFAKTLPNLDCILFDKWTSQNRDCGGHCFSTDVRYNAVPGDSPRGGFYLAKHRSVPNAWKVMYAIEVSMYPVPADTIGFYMFV